MSTTRKKAAEPSADAHASPYADESAEQRSRVYPGDDVPPGETRTARIFDEMQPGDTVRILRENDHTRDREYHGSLNYESATLENIAEMFGGGMYRLQLMRRHATKGITIFRTMGQQIPGPYKPPQGPLPGQAAVIPAATANDAASVAATMRTPTAGDSMSPRELLDYAALNRMMEMMKQPVGGGGGGMLRELAPVLTPFAAALATILTTAMTREKKPDTALVRQLEDMRAALEKLQERPSPQAAGVDEVLAMVEKFGSIRQKLAGGGEDEGDMWKGMLKTGMEFLNRGQMGPPPAANAPQLGSGAAPAPDLPLWHRMLLEYAEMIIGAAQTNKNPAMAAGVVVEWCPEQYRGALLELASATNTETLLVHALPALGQFPTWVTEFVEAVRGELFEGEGEDDSEPKTDGAE